LLERRRFYDGKNLQTAWLPSSSIGRTTGHFEPEIYGCCDTSDLKKALLDPIPGIMT